MRTGRCEIRWALDTARRGVFGGTSRAGTACRAPTGENQLADWKADLHEQHRRAGEASLAQHQGGGKPPHSLNCLDDRVDDGLAPLVPNVEG